MMKNSTIEKKLAKMVSDDNMFFIHNNDGTGKVLWQDKDEGEWNVSSYYTVPELGFGSMPDENFTRCT